MYAPLSFKNLIAAISLVAQLAACDQGGNEAPAGMAGGGMPPAAVSVVTVAAEPIPIQNELPGRIAPTRIAEVRPRVSGIIVERVFEQGSMVKQGDVLYRIDPEPFRLRVESARATLQRAEAVRLQARQEANRQSELRERKVASGQQYDNAVAVLAQAEADVAAARAGLSSAELDLQYAEVKAPISGRIGRALITEGALVSANGSENLATIQQLDPVYADFTQSASQLLELRRALKVGALTSSDPGEATVRLLMDDGREYPHAGRLLFSEAAVDATTGQVTLRGEFPNPDGDLLPGMYVRVVIEQGIQPNAIAVPQQAVQRDAGGQAQIYVVADDGSTELRAVQAGRVQGSRWVIDRGLNPGDRVIVEGFQKIRPGAKVQPQAWNADKPAPEKGAQAAAKTAKAG
jgi:membrane fusion protein (multidrug efflux system)